MSVLDDVIDVLQWPAFSTDGKGAGPIRAEAKAELAALRARIERLEELLRDIADRFDSDDIDAVLIAVDHARAALEE